MIGICDAASATTACAEAVRPVVPITTASPSRRQASSQASAPSGEEKSITTSGREGSSLETFTPNAPSPASVPMSWPRHSLPAGSIAPTISNCSDSIASAAIRLPIRPPAPMIAILIMLVVLVSHEEYTSGSSTAIGTRTPDRH